MFGRAYDPVDPPVPLHQLTTRQRTVLEAIDAFEGVTGEPCSAAYLARRLRIARSTVADHLAILHRKGWLTSAASPVRMKRHTR